MNIIKDKIKIRDLRNGDWYWIQKTIIKEYVPKVGAIGITVYNFLASMANNSQTCFPSQKYMAQCLGYSRATINKTLKLLSEAGLVRIEKRTRYHLVYSLLMVTRKGGGTQMLSGRNPDVTQGNTNDNKITRINNIDNNKIMMNPSFYSIPGFKPKTKEELLALDLAEGLNDLNGLPLYISLAKRYPESFLRGVLSEVRKIPADKIKKTRGALFNYIVQKHAP